MGRIPHNPRTSVGGRAALHQAPSSPLRTSVLMPKLGAYYQKRRPEATNEPFSGQEPDPQATHGTLEGHFVIHLHSASRRHYDVRLEVAGVLASFAVPKGPSLNPDDKHLAVKTEDHPLEYLEFEDVIPGGQYGAGPMIVWDRGRVEYLEGPAEEELERGKLHIRLYGMKVQGAFALVKLAKSEKGNEWLLFKKPDGYASADRDILAESPRSVLSGLTVDELREKTRLGDLWRAEAARYAGANTGANAGAGAVAREDWPLVEAEAAHDLPHNGGPWAFDANLDGLRCFLTRCDDVVRLHVRTEAGTGARTGAAVRAVESLFPEIVRAARAWPVRHVAMDGQLTMVGEDGRPNLSLLWASTDQNVGVGSGHRGTPMFLAYDILALGDVDLRGAALESRRSLLSKILPSIGIVRAVPLWVGSREALFAFCLAHGLSHVTAKKVGSSYDTAMRGSWIALATGAPVDAAPSRPWPKAHSQPRHVAISNRGKVFWPDDGYTKGDLVDYYGNVAQVLLPYVRNRPVIVVRYPDGIAGKSFFQWNVPPGMPPWVQTLPIDDQGETKRGFLIDEAPTLLYLANLGCIPLHVLAFRTPRTEFADFLTIDFDVKQSEFAHAVTLAATLRDLLDDVGLVGFPKTSGQSGLHVLVPLGPGKTFETARSLADLLGRLLVERHKSIATMERRVAKRGPRVYVDTGQTGPTRAIVAPFSVRAVRGATVSTPLRWEEVSPDLDPRAFTIKTVPERVAHHGDPMAGILAVTPDLEGAVHKLAKHIQSA